MGELVPLAARGQHIENRVDDFAQGVLGWGAAAFAFASVEGFFEAGFKECPLFVGQVAGIGLSLAHSGQSIPELTFLDRFLERVLNESASEPETSQTSHNFTFGGAL